MKQDQIRKGRLGPGAGQNLGGPMSFYKAEFSGGPICGPLMNPLRARALVLQHP